MQQYISHVARALREPPGEEAFGQAVRYVVVAGCGYLLAMATYASELGVGIAPYAAIVVAFVLNGLFNFSMVRIWAFPPTRRHARSELTRFCVVAVGSLLVNYGSFALSYSVLGIRAIVAQAIAIAVAAPFGFLANRHWSFRTEAA